MADPFKIDWAPVVGFEGRYSVSTDGRVRSEARQCLTKSGGSRDVTQRELRPTYGPRGYPSVTLFALGVRHYKRVHLLVLEAFIGSAPRGMEGAHNDGNPSNCCLENLRWDTHVGNISDKERHGTLLRGSSHPRAKLTADLVRSIRSDTRLLKEIARDYGVTIGCVSEVRRNKVWRWLHA